jgi:predicted MFS family arabinose efflux permease
MSAVLPARRLASRAATTALFVGNGFLIGTWAANIPRVRDLHHLSDTGLGTVLLAFGLGAVAAMALTSALAARIGAGRVASIAGVLLAVLFPLLALVSGWPVLLTLAVVLGAVNGAMDVSMNAYASQLERRWGGAIMSSFHAGWSIGGLAGAALAGVLAGAGWGLTEALAAASCVVAGGGLYGLTLPMLDRGAPRQGALRLPSRRLAAASLLAALCFAAEGAVADWSGVYLVTVVGTDAAWATTGYAAFALAMVAGRLTGDAVVGRLGPGPAVRLGAMLAFCGLSLALAVPNRWAVDAGLILVGTGLANVVPVVFSAAGRMAGTNGVATASACGYAGLLVAPPLLGNLADALGLRVALLLVVLGIAAMALLARSVVERPADA